MDFPTFTSDYLPTLIDVLDLDYPDNRPLDGISLMPFLKKPLKQRKKPMGFAYKNRISWVTYQFKLVSENLGKTFELYDLLNDKSEKNNLINLKPKLAKKMKKELDNWLVSVNNSKKGNDY